MWSVLSVCLSQQTVTSSQQTVTSQVLCGCREMMDSMQDAGKYDWAFGLGFMYSYILTVPHSVAINLAYPTEIAL